MKAAVLYSLVATLSLSSLNAFAEDTCNSGGGAPTGGVDGPYGPNPYGPVDGGLGSPYSPVTNDPYYPTAATVPAVYPAPATPAPAVSPAVTQSNAPKARITVVDSEPVTSSDGPTASRTPGVRLTVVDDAPVFPTKPAAQLADVKLPAVDNKPEENTETIDAALKGLIGTWKAVARHGDGELTTVELQLDDRGWAELTVPAADGTRSTIKRRARLENEELKLTSPDSELSLGKLVTFNTRQMVLDRSGGQVTFVRL